MKNNKRDDHRHCLRFNAEEIRMMEEAMQECESLNERKYWEPGEGLAFGRWMLLDIVDSMTGSQSLARERRIVESVRRERRRFWRYRRQSTSPKTAKGTRVQKERVIPRKILSTRVAMWITALLLGMGALQAQPAQAENFKVLYNFNQGTNGGYPFAGLVRDAAGNLYGTTEYGGDLNCNEGVGCGTVFKVNQGGTVSILYSFTGGTIDPCFPVGGLLRDNAGNLYGTSENCGSSGYGTVWKLSKEGNETVLYSFPGGAGECYPTGGLVRDLAGNFYGTTIGYGYCPGYGSVFKLSKNGTLTLLHSFSGGADGGQPYSTSVLMDTAGNLYGVTEKGGDLDCDNGLGCGVLYKLTKSGVLKVLHTFKGETTDGCWPLGTPAMDTKGNLYGTTEVCGSFGGGTVWKVSKEGAETVLHNFDGSDGDAPMSGVIMGAKGNLYGDTEAGGTSGAGTVYELSERGILTVLHNFDYSDGEVLTGGLVRDAKGNLYGTALEGGAGGYGTVWKLTPRKK